MVIYGCFTGVGGWGGGQTNAHSRLATLGRWFNMVAWSVADVSPPPPHFECAEFKNQPFRAKLNGSMAPRAVLISRFKIVAYLYSTLHKYLRPMSHQLFQHIVTQPQKKRC